MSKRGQHGRELRTFTEEDLPMTVTEVAVIAATSRRVFLEDGSAWTIVRVLATADSWRALAERAE